MQVILELFLVFLDLAVELVDKRVDGRVHVGLAGLGKNVIATHVYSGFRDVIQVLQRKDHVRVAYFVKMAFQLSHFFIDIVSE